MDQAAFILPTPLPLRLAERLHVRRNSTTQPVRRIRPTSCKVNEGPERDDAQSEKIPQAPAEPLFGRFDESPDTDAFGRDPKKETEFWKDHARSVLESAEVREAIEQHAKDGGDGTTDEQRAYMEFIQQLDDDKGGGAGEVADEGPEVGNGDGEAQ